MMPPLAEIGFCYGVSITLLQGAWTFGQRLVRAAWNAPGAFFRLAEGFAVRVRAWAAWTELAARDRHRGGQHCARGHPPAVAVARPAPALLPAPVPCPPFGPAPMPAHLAESMTPLGDTTAVQVALVRAWTPPAGRGQR